MKKLPFIIGASVFGILTVALTVAHMVLPQYRPQLNSYFHINTTKIVETGEVVDSNYFKSEFASLQEQMEEESRLCMDLEAEGAVLLKNNDKTLPFSSSSKFSLFSTSSVDPIYGGTGSGQVSANDAVNLRKALNEEFKEGGTNTTLYKHYLQDLSGYRRVNAATTGGTIDQYRINEAPWSEVLTNDVRDSLSDFPNAIVVLARSGGEGNDLPITECADGIGGNYLILNQNEKDMLHGLKALKDEGKLQKIVVLLNGSNSLQLDFLDQAEYAIDAAVWIGGVGTNGMTSVAELLSGKRNFSGRLSDTFLKNNLSAPSIANFGLHAYTNSSVGSGEYQTGWVQYNQPSAAMDRCNENYIVYQEGIYIGYRYYETRYADLVMGQGNTAGYDYHADVAYPFGFGESYTTWSYSDFSLTESGDSLNAKVTVTNSGEVKGKHAVEIYAGGTYTDYDKEHHVEKSAVNLVGFTKTKELQPGASETVEISVRKRDLASYDREGAKTYILDGEYFFTVGKNAHDANNNILAKRGYSAQIDAPGNANLVHSWVAQGVDAETASKSEFTGKKITNAFAHADLNLYEGTANQKITYLTRSDWNGTFPKEAVSLAITPKMWEDGLDFSASARDARVEKLKREHYADYLEADLPEMGKPSVLSVVALRELDFTAKEWDELISQASYEDMTNLIYNGFHQTVTVSSIGLPATADENGPQGYTAALISGAESAHGMAYTSEDVMASTRNVELLKRMGECIGEDCLAAKNAGLYGPGANVHRNPYCGRNFEYYSEDPFLSSKLQEKEVAGIQSKGVYVFTKHFALNDQESGRYGISTWSNEQAIREIYLRAFEGTPRAGGYGVMSSFNRIGVTWSGNDYSLMTTVLREEWGVQGAAITDCSVYATYMDVAAGVLAGQDLWDGNAAPGTSMATLDKYSKDPVVTRAAQQATKHIAYSISRSLAMNGISSTTKIVFVEEWYLTLTRILPIVFGALTGACVVMIFVAARKKKS